ncbi:FAD dependent oxidoreductase-domain-containing protein [Lactifluus volemus]|nr:FAD dependent oxidoreductase-domain-containing protein [Lactifluus volemus]
MGNIIARLNVLIHLIRQLDADYRSVKERIQRSPDLPVNNPTVSFWTVPPAKLPAPPPALPSHVDVLVIGSGITGLSCTRTLLNKGPSSLRVLVLEARDVCSGATGRNGGHINPPLFHDYVQLKSEFGIESAKRIIRFRLAHLSAMREAVEGIGALEHSQIRDVEALNVHFHPNTFEEHVKELEVWRAEMPKEAANCRVFKGSEAAKMFQLSEKVVGVVTYPGGAAHPYRTVTCIFADLLKRYPDRLDLFTQTACTGITPPTATTPLYTIQTPRATAQRPGTRLSTQTGTRSHTFFHVPPGYDYLTQLPKLEGQDDGGELLFGGGLVRDGRVTMSEVGVADDGDYDLGVASHVQGALPEYFGLANWGAESASPTSSGSWDSGRVKALWTGILGFSADMQPWVGRVPGGSGSSTGSAAGEWVSAGYSGEGMVHAWLCAHALALMVLGVEEEEGLRTWFPDEFRLSEKRWKVATPERLVDRF